jgi:hypothetical protein
MYGYWNNPAETDEKLRRLAVHRRLCSQDADGFFYFTAASTT